MNMNKHHCLLRCTSYKHFSAPILNADIYCHATNKSTGLSNDMLNVLYSGREHSSTRFCPQTLFSTEVTRKFLKRVFCFSSWETLCALRELIFPYHAFSSREESSSARRRGLGVFSGLNPKTRHRQKERVTGPWVILRLGNFSNTLGAMQCVPTF